MSYRLKPCSCGVLMVFLKHERTGFEAPINPEALPADRAAGIPAGNVFVDLLAGTYRIVTASELEQLSGMQRAELRLNHFVTCPDRQRYRGGHGRSAVKA